jgi:hypothetical protein
MNLAILYSTNQQTVEAFRMNLKIAQIVTKQINVQMTHYTFLAQPHAGFTGMKTN